MSQNGYGITQACNVLTQACNVSALSIWSTLPVSRASLLLSAARSQITHRNHTNQTERKNAPWATKCACSADMLSSDFHARALLCRKQTSNNSFIYTPSRTLFTHLQNLMQTHSKNLMQTKIAHPRCQSNANNLKRARTCCRSYKASCGGVSHNLYLNNPLSDRERLPTCATLLQCDALVRSNLSQCPKNV